VLGSSWDYRLLRLTPLKQLEPDPRALAIGGGGAGESFLNVFAGQDGSGLPDTLNASTSVQQALQQALSASTQISNVLNSIKSATDAVTGLAKPGAKIPSPKDIAKIKMGFDQVGKALYSLPQLLSTLVNPVL
jgi:hypothetical protein